MFPDACESCGLETDDLENLEKRDSFLHWFICKHCKGRLYQHEFFARRDFIDLCISCGQKRHNKIHT